MCKIVGAETTLAYMLKSTTQVSSACLHKKRLEVAKEFSEVLLDIDGYAIYSAVVMHPELFGIDTNNCVVRANGSEDLYNDQYLDDCYLDSLPVSRRAELREKLSSAA